MTDVAKPKATITIPPSHYPLIWPYVPVLHKQFSRLAVEAVQGGALGSFLECEILDDFTEK